MDTRTPSLKKNFEVFAIFLIITFSLIFNGCKKDKNIENEHPDVKTLLADILSPTKIILKGSFSSDRAIKVSDYGFIYSYYEYFDQSNSVTVSLGNQALNGEFTKQIDNINTDPFSTGDNLFVKAYYKNSDGITFGEVRMVRLLKVAAYRVTPIQGQSGDQIKITGAFFISTSEKVDVRFNDVPAKIISASNNQLIVEIPAGVPVRHQERATILINVDGQLALASNSFNMIAHFKDFSPKSGTVGTQITFTGDNLPAGHSTVDDIHVYIDEKEGGRGADDQFIAIIPESKVLNSKVRIEVGDVETTLPETFTYTPPVITSVSPLFGLAGEVLTFKGINFPVNTGFTNTYIKVGDLTESASFYQGNIIAGIPFSLLPGTYSVSLTSGPNTVYAPEKVTVLHYRITGFSPSTAFPLANITITGTFNQSQDYFVYFGDTKVLGRATSNSELEVGAPLANNGKIVDIIVEMVGGQKIPVPGKFKTLGPTITSFTSAFGPPGTEITIHGTNFRPQFYSATVDLGSEYASGQIVDENTIKATVPIYAKPFTAALKIIINSQVAESTETFTIQ
ncbi:MAG: hypothetical protein JWQ25_2606 [Daejeonella sp.]|nr:hypothetical protein [Daejeonella sp.]